MHCCKDPCVEILGLRVVEANAGAVALYQSLGFVEEGRLRRGAKLPSDEYSDELHMSLHLEQRTAVPETRSLTGLS